MTTEPGGDAHVGVVARNVICAEQRTDNAIDDLGEASPFGFARDDHARGLAQFVAESGQFGIGKLVEYQVSDYGRVGRVAGESLEIFLMPRARVGPLDRTGPKIESCDWQAAAMQSRTQFPGAGSELKHGFAGAEQGGQRVLKPVRRAQEAVDDAKIATVVQRIRVIVRQRVEQLGLKRALHAGRRGDRRREGGAPQFFATKVARLRQAVQSSRHIPMSLIASPNLVSDTPAVPAVPVRPVDLIAEAASNFPHRPSWDEYFMATAVLMSSRSNCERLHVGCVIVTGGERKNRIVAAGYNGFLPSTPHVSRVRDGHEQATVHAEQNAVADAARRGSSVEGCIAYVTHFPCINCAKILAAAGIAEIKYRADYLNDPLVAPLLADAGVKVLKL